MAWIVRREFLSCILSLILVAMVNKYKKGGMLMVVLYLVFIFLLLYLFYALLNPEKF